MRKKTLLTFALALCCSGTLSAGVITANAGQSLSYSQVEVLQGISTDNIFVTDLNGNEVSLVAGPHGGTGDKRVFVDGVIHSTQTALLADSEGKGVLGYVTIDAGQEYVVNKMLVDIVHDWGAADFSIELSTDAAFSDPVVIYSNKADEGFTADSDHVVSSVLFNKAMQGLTFEFSPVKARYVRITGNTFGNGQLWGWTCLGEVQMWAVKDTLDVYADLPTGSYEGEQMVSLGSTVEGAEIYYTMDGSIPTKSSTKYEGPISVLGEKKIRAVAYANGKYGYPFDFNYFAASSDTYEVGANYCLNKTVTAYDTSGNELFWAGHNGGSSLAAAVDGVMGTDNSFKLVDAEGNAANGWIQVDMEESVWINKVNLTLWHDWVFRSIAVQVSDDPTFTTGVTTILSTDIAGWKINSAWAGSMDSTFNYNREWIKHSGNGWELNFEPVKGRYIRTFNQAGQGDYATVLTELQAWTCADPNATENVYEYKNFVSSVDYTDAMEVYCDKAFDQLGLPTELLVKYSDGREKTLAVTWNATAYNAAEAGVYAIKGTVSDELDAYGLLSAVTVNVTVKALDLAAINTAIQTACGVETNKYTTTTTTALAEAKTAAEGVLAQGYKTQDEVDAATTKLTSAYEALKLRGDVAALAELVNQWKDKEQGNFTTSSYAAFGVALEAGKNAVAENGNVDLEQAQVDAIYEMLETSAKTLTACADADDYAALQTAEKRISDAIADESKITVSGFATAQALVAEAKVLLDADAEKKADTAAEPVKAATDKLNAYEILYRGDIAALEAAYNGYKTEYGYSETDTNGYHIENYCVYLDAMYAVEPLFVAGASDDMTQADLDVYADALTDSIALLVKHADVSALTSEYANAQALNAADYTTTSYVAFEVVLGEVGLVVAKPANTLLQAQADEALAKLAAGVNALVKLGNKEALKQLIAVASSEDAEDYTSTTFATLTKALFNANKAKNSNDVSEEDVKAVVDALQVAYDGLVKLGDKTQLVEYIDKAKATDTSTFSEQKLADLNAAIEYAQTILDFEGEVTAEQVETAKALINAAIALNTTVNCASTVCGIGALVTVLGAGVCALRKKEEK